MSIHEATMRRRSSSWQRVTSWLALFLMLATPPSSVFAEEIGDLRTVQGGGEFTTGPEGTTGRDILDRSIFEASHVTVNPDRFLDLQLRNDGDRMLLRSWAAIDVQGALRSNGNVYLASIMKMVSLYKDDPFIEDMISEGMNRFMTEHVCCFREYRDVTTHFVGSIGYYFEKQLREQAAILGVNVGKIAKKPIEGLVQYHLQAEHV